MSSRDTDPDLHLKVLMYLGYWQNERQPYLTPPFALRDLMQKQNIIEGVDSLKAG
jgi:hypothetical protein